MTIEVRQLLINASVGTPVPRAQGERVEFAEGDGQEEDPYEHLREQLHEQLLGELKGWLEDRLSRMRER